MKGILFLVFLQVVLGGWITPKTTKPILLEYNNQGYTSDYTFSFQIETATYTQSVLVIEFPSPNYDQNNFIAASCTATDEKGNNYASCTRAGYQVSVEVGELSNSPVDHTYTVILKDVLNPSTTGGTGNFRLETWKGINPLDKNDRFAAVGVIDSAPVINQFNIVCITNWYPSLQATYSLNIEFSQIIPAEARLTLQFPTTLTLLGPPPCTAELIPYIACTRDSSNLVTIAEIDNDIPANTLVQIIFTSVTNQEYSGSIGDFSLEILDPNVNNVLTYAFNVAGPILDPGTLTGIYICPSFGDASCDTNDTLANQGTIHNMTLKATTANAVPTGGAIKIEFPNAGLTFTLVADTCQVLSGLNHSAASESGQISCVVDVAAHTLTITNFSVASAGEFSLKVRATYPTPGPATSNAFTFTTYQTTAMTNIIDTQTGNTVSITDKVPPNKFTLEWLAPTDPTAGATMNFQTTFRPAVNVSAPDLTVQFRFDSGWNIASTTASMTPFNYAQKTGITAVWDSTARTLQVPSTDFISLEVFDNSNDNSILLNGAIQPPSIAGTYILEVIIYNASGKTVNDIDSHQTWTVDVIGSTFTSFSWEMYSVDVNQKTVYDLSFVPSLNIPTSTPSTNVSTDFGYIDIIFMTQNADFTPRWASDLSTGLSSGTTVPCRNISGFVPATGLTNIVCTIFTDATSPYIRLAGFDAITAATTCRLMIADIGTMVYGGVTENLTIRSLTTTAGIASPINESSAAYTGYTSYDDFSVAVPTWNGRSPAEYGGGDGKNIAQFISNTVNESAEMRFVLWPDYTLTATSYLFIKVPLDRAIPRDGVTCYQDYSTTPLTTCWTFPDAGWIFIDSAATMTHHVEYTFQIKGLTNPIHRIPKQPIEIVAVGNDRRETEYIKFTESVDLDLGSVNQISITPSSYAANAIDVTYTFAFSLTNSVAVNGKIVLSFPEEDYTLNTFPALECTYSGGLSDESTSETLRCQQSDNTIIIDQFAAISAGVLITINVKHVLNPPEITTTGLFFIESYSDSSYLQDGDYEIDGINIVTALAIGQIQHTGFTADPTNGTFNADYTVSFQPSQAYPQYSTIEITFPSSEFGGFALAQTCSISGGLITIFSCVSDGNNKVTVTTDEKYNFGQPLHITVHNLDNFEVLEESGAVYVEVKYSGVIIDESPKGEDERRFTTTTVPATMSLTASYTPQTAAEEAVYKFEIRPRTNFSEECNVHIRFPDIYARGLGDFLQCFSDLTSWGNIDCTVDDLDLIISPGVTWDASLNAAFNVTVDRIMNPNKETTNSVLFLTFVKCGTHMQDYFDLTEVWNFNTYSSQMYLESLVSTNLYYGYDADITLKGQMTAGIAGTDDDRILVDFPAEYKNLIYVQDDMTCDSLLTTSTTTDTCDYLNNRLTINGYDTATDHSSTLYTEFKVSNIENPEEIGEVNYISVGLWQNNTDQVVSRSFPNLNEIISFSYLSAGDEIVVNYNNEFSLQRGTMSDSIPVIIQNSTPAAVSISPDSLPNGISIIPEKVYFEVGSNTASFQLSASQDSDIGQFYIEWSWKLEESSDYTFSPVKRTFVNIIDSEQETITIESTNLIPRAGSSQPLEISLSRSCDSSITLTIYKIGSLPTLVEFLPQTITFTRGETLKTYTISIPADAKGSQGEYSILLTGTDASRYSMSGTLFQYEVADPDTTPPVVVDFYVAEISRTSAKFVLTVNEPIVLYYMCTLNGTIEPTAAELKAGELSETKATGLYMQPISGSTKESVTNEDGTYTYTFAFTTLTAQTPYRTWLYIEDLGGNAPETQRNEIFTTSSRYNSASVQMKFEITNPDEYEDSYVIKAVAEVLKIAENRVLIRTNYNEASKTSNPFNSAAPTATTTSSGRNNLQTTFVDLVILPDPTDPSDTTPNQLANQLQELKLQLSALLPPFDSTYFLYGTEIVGQTVTFAATPSVVSVVDQNLVVRSAGLTNDGTVHLCVLSSGSSNETPSSWQIYNGVNAANYPCDVKSTFLNPIENEQIRVSGLVASTTYHAFFSASNNLQGYPDLLSDTNVVKLEFTTGAIAEDDDFALGLISIIGFLLFI